MNNQTTKTCTKCHTTLPTSEFNKQLATKDGFQPHCKVCHRAAVKQNRADWKKANPYLQIINNRWAAINQRTANGKFNSSFTAQNNPQTQSYQKKGITLELTFQEFKDWMLENEEKHNQIVLSGDNSSIDRLDETKGYSLDNIQMISLHENIEKRYGKKCEKNKLTKEETKNKNRKQYLKYVKLVEGEK